MEQQKLPNSTVILVLSIFSIVLCWCYGVVGLLLGIVALVLANKDTKTYHIQPEIYTDFTTVKAGKIIAIVGLILNIIFLLFMVWLLSIIGLDALQDEELMRERMEDFFNN